MTTTNTKKSKTGGRTTPSKPKTQAGVTSASEWKKANSSGVELALPSGKVCLVKRMGPQAFLGVGDGNVPNGLLSLIMPLLEEAGKKGAAQSTEESVSQAQLDEIQSKILNDHEKMLEMLELIDNVTVACVMEPKVNSVPTREVEVDGEIVEQKIPMNEREDQELLYVDEVDADDKTFIFNFVVGGSADLDRFRQATS